MNYAQYILIVFAVMGFTIVTNIHIDDVRDEIIAKIEGLTP